MSAAKISRAVGSFSKRPASKKDWRVLLRFRQRVKTFGAAQVKKFLTSVLLHPSLSHIPGNVSEVSLLFTSDQEMRAINKRFRKKDKTTDVLSFPLLDGGATACLSLGDLVISVPAAKRQAKIFGVALEQELKRLLIHGALHLCGYNHEKVSRKDAQKMRRLEKKLFSELVEERRKQTS